VAYPPDTQSFVCVMSPEDLKEHVIYTSPDRWDCPVWPPDNQSLLGSSKGKLYRLSLTDARPVLFPTGGVSPGRDYCFSRDGSRLAFTAGDGIYLVPGTGGEPTLIEPRRSGYLHGISPDGQQVVYNGVRSGGDFAIYRRPIDGGEETPLTTRRCYNDGPDYSPDGKWVYFSSDRSGKKSIWRIPAEGGGANDERAERITTDEIYDDWFPHPSPDGRWLLFLSSAKGSSKGTPEKGDVLLRLMPLPGDRPGKNTVRETAWFIGGQGTINAPCWSPDGKRFAYARYAPRQ
jgi:Tol biopolymer transport system component